MKIWQAHVDTALDTWLPKPNIEPFRLHEAMRYSVFNGGKRLRPVLVYAAGMAMEVPTAWLHAPACAIECIHAYSLIHDDLPAMDDDDLRRGKPTCHRAFDEATAILAGDALQALAVHILSHGLDRQIPAEQRLAMIDLLAVSSGSRGMAGGQALDLGAVGKTLTEAELENMHIHKTGALIRSSVLFGVLCSNNPQESVKNQLDHYAKCIGLAFQIHDDVLDETADTATLGKTQGADRARNKPTYPAIIGLDASIKLAQELADEAIDSLTEFNDNAAPLRDLARYVIERRN
ncbi:MAG: (2E,6E)-farnesyl diphosphate synthase [Gammaproteobacteria bacterium]|nr:(2E,6E)-farnesyl diphosphate synthase [Gammaproteobacteria bacterium]